MSGVKFRIGTVLGDVVIDPETGKPTNATGERPSYIVQAGLWALHALGLTVTVETPLGDFGPVSVDP